MTTDLWTRLVEALTDNPGSSPIETADVVFAVVTEPLREEQVNLWSDLNDAVKWSQTKPPVIPGRWSMHCNWLAERIVTSAQLIGAVSWQHIQTDLLLAGIYEKVLYDAGIPHAPVDWDQVRELFNRNHQWTGETWDGPPVDLIGGAQ